MSLTERKRMCELDMARAGLRSYVHHMNRIMTEDGGFRGSEEDYSRFLDAIRVLEGCVDSYTLPKTMDAADPGEDGHVA